MKSNLRCLAVALLAVSMSPLGYSVNTGFNGPDGGDWGTPGNWDTSNVPTSADNAFSARNTTVILSSGAFQADTLWVGNVNGGGLAGTVQIDGGSLSLGGGTGAAIGGDGRNGTLVMNGGLLNRIGGNNADLRIGHSGGATGTVIMGGSSQIDLRDLRTGDGGNANFTLNGGSANFAGWANIGSGANNTSTINVAGGSLAFGGRALLNDGANSTVNLNISSGSFSSTELQTNQGTTQINITGGTLTNNNWFDLSANANNTTTVNVSGTGTLNVGNANTSIGLRGAATVNIASGGVVNTGDNRFTIGEGRDNVTTATGVVNVNSGGTLNGSNNSNFRLNIGGDDDANDNGQGILNINGGNVNLFAGGIRVGKQGGVGTVNHTSGTLNGPAATMWMSDSSGAQGYYNLSGGTVNLNTVSIGQHGNATFNTSGGLLTTDNLVVGAGSSGSPLAIYSQTGGTAQVGTLSIGNSGSVGTLTLEGGSLGVDTFNAIPADGSAFNWGNGSLTVRNPATGGSGSTDFTDNVNGAFTGPSVFSGSTATLNASIATGYNGGSSVLDLGGFYLNSGVRVDQINLGATGVLDLSAANDVLAFDATTVYLLRPFGFFTEDYGSIPLITSSGGTIIGNFDTYLGPTNDSRGYTQLATVVGGPMINPFTDLADDQGVFQLINNEVWFHYRLNGQVPEPGTFGMMLMGTLFLKTLRRRRKEGE